MARRGDWDSATREINRCLERARSSATLYAAACVIARAYGSSARTATAGQALDLLERAGRGRGPRQGRRGTPTSPRSAASPGSLAWPAEDNISHDR